LLPFIRVARFDGAGRININWSKQLTPNDIK